MAFTSSTPPPGLCGDCVWTRIVETRRGSTFHLCNRSETDPAFPRYPRLPVLRCHGYRPVGPEGRSDPHSAPPDPSFSVTDA